MAVYIDIAWYFIIAILSYAALSTLWSIARRVAIDKETILNELKELGQGRPEGKIDGVALIAGGSIAGLNTARVCADFFTSVIVVEPELLVDGKRTRIGQAQQIHGMQPPALAALRKLYPGFDAEAAAADARIGEATVRLRLGDVPVKFKRGVLPEFMVISRLGLESLLRRLLARVHNVKIVQGTVLGVIPSTDGTRVDSVIIRPANGSKNVTLPVAFLADCCGPSAIGLKWLEKAPGVDWSMHKRHVYDPKITYTTATVPIPPQIRESLPLYTHEDYEGGYEKLAFVKSFVPGPNKDQRGLWINRVEGHRLMLCVGGWGIDTSILPTTMDELIDTVRQLYALVVDEKNRERDVIIETLELLRDTFAEDGYKPEFVNYKMGQCHFVDYNPAYMPSNYAALGDSLVRVNPTFGQGIGKALIDATSLAGTLRTVSLDKNQNGTLSLPRHFAAAMLKRQIPRVKPMWESTRASDYGRPTTIPVEGETLDKGQFFREYQNALVQIAKDDRDVAAIISLTIQSFAPVMDLLQPSLFVKAMWKRWQLSH